MTRTLANTLLRVLLAIAIASGIGYWLFVKDMYYTPTAELRGGREWPPARVKIAVPWPHDGRMSLMEGATLALEELNASESPLAKRIELEFYDEPMGAIGHGPVAREIADDREVVAVIGHESSEAAVVSAVTYDKRGILYLSPKATLSRLTDHELPLTFRMVPDDGAFAQALANFAKNRGWLRIGMLYGRFEQGEALVRQFSLHARAALIRPVYYRSYLPQADPMRHDFREMIASMRAVETDAILLADQFPWAAKVLVDMQAMGVTQPIMAGDKLDSSDAWRLAGSAADNLYVASAVDPDAKDPDFAAFRDRFRKRFGSNPGYGSSQGYETFATWVKAAETSRSVDPVVVATTLKTNKWEGIFGPFEFTQSGAVVGRKVVIKKVQDGTFQTVSLVEVTP